MSDNPTPSLSLDQKRQVLTRFSKAIKREAHNLQQRPDLLYQQLYNRLQWDEEPMAQVLKPEFERRTAPGAAPWMRVRTPFRESEALIRTLAGHTDWVNACCMSPDGRWIVSGSMDDTLKVWDVWTGQEQMTLSGHINRVTACCMSPDGRWIVSGSFDNTLKVWDVETGQVQAGIVLPGGIACLGLHPWRPLLACGDAGGSVYFVDLMGIEYGPIIVTAVDFGAGSVVRCPACQSLSPLQDEWLGQVVSCPQPGCEGRMRVNPFVCSTEPAKAWQRLYDLLSSLPFFKAAWDANSSEVKRYWAQIEGHSPLRRVDAYQPVLKAPAKHDTDVVECVAILLEETGYLMEALSLREYLSERYRQTGDVEHLQNSLCRQGNILSARGDLDGAMALYEEQERLCRESGNRDGLATALGRQGNIHCYRKDLDGAMALYKEAERAFQELGNRDGLATVRGNQGIILSYRGDLDGAMALYKEAADTFRELGNQIKLAIFLDGQGAILSDRGDQDGAMALYKEEERICREMGDRVGLERSLANQAALTSGDELEMEMLRLMEAADKEADASKGDTQEVHDNTEMTELEREMLRAMSGEDEEGQTKDAEDEGEGGEADESADETP